MNKNKTNILSGLTTTLLILSVIIFSGCAKNDRKILNNFQNRTFDFEQEKDNVKVGAKFLTKKEFNTIFKGSSKSKQKKILRNYQATQINIDNKNDKSYLLNKDSFTSKIMQKKTVIQELQQDKALRHLTYASTLGILTGIYGGITIFRVFHSSSTLIAISLASIIPIAMISSFLYGTFLINKVEKENKILRKKIQKQVFNLNKEEIIKHNNKFKAIIFIPKKELFDIFSISLLNPETQNMELEFLLSNSGL